MKKLLYLPLAAALCACLLLPACAAPAEAPQGENKVPELSSFVAGSMNGRAAQYYAQMMGLDYYQDVLEVYISDEITAEETANYSTSYDFYIDEATICTGYTWGELVSYSSYPGGLAASKTAAFTMPADFSLDFVIGAPELTAKLGFTQATSFTLYDTYRFALLQDAPCSVACYPCIAVSSFDVYEDDLFFDDYVGNYTAARPVGCVFVLSAEKV